MFSPIHHTFAPHVTLSYVLRTKWLLFRPWRWRSGPACEHLRSALREHLKGDISLFASGREALVALFRSLREMSGEEIILQAYTCVVVPNAIHAAGCVPVYADIDRETLNLDCDDVERRITPRTRAIVCQHTFGIPANAARLREICNRHGLLLIEDCAHIIPDASGPAAIGTHGDFLLLSFGRDKAISGITGGAMISRKPEISARLRKEEANAAPLSLFTIWRLLCYPLVYGVARPLYGIGIGKALLVAARKIGALVPILEEKEKDGKMSPILHALPHACAALALWQLKNFRAINDHRRQLTALYLSEITNEKRKRGNENPIIPNAIHPSLPLQKFPLFVRGADEIRRKLKHRNIHLNDGWTGCVVCPPDSHLDSVNYVPGSDPEAEAACKKILSLPTHPTMTKKQAMRLMENLQRLLKKM